MRWFEYKMEVDDLHASDDLKAKLLAMQGGQTASSAPKAAPKPRKACSAASACMQRSARPSA